MRPGREPSRSARAAVSALRAGGTARIRGAPMRGAARPKTAPLPEVIAPMLATLAPALPAPEDGWAFEFKWDGVRAIVRWDGKRLAVLSRNLNEVTHRYPELAGLGKALGRRPVILDGEIVALDGRGRPSFPLLTRRMHVEDPRAIVRLSREIPACLVLFDVLHERGRPLLDVPWERRRERLEALGLGSEAWLVPPARVGRGQGSAMLEAARRQELEGVMAKRLGSVYRPGARSADWLKVKIVADDEFVIGGWVPELGTRLGRVGALLVGQFDESGRLRYAGSVGTGFDDAAHRSLSRLLTGLEQPAARSPFADPVPKRGARFVEPKLVATIEYRRRVNGILHQAAFKGLRGGVGGRQ